MANLYLSVVLVIGNIALFVLPILIVISDEEGHCIKLETDSVVNISF